MFTENENWIEQNKLNRLTQQLLREIETIKNISTNKYLKEFTDEQFTAYLLCKAIKKINKPIQHMPPIRTENGMWVKSCKQKVDPSTWTQENVKKLKWTTMRKLVK